jgi:hypothetical protein
LNPISSFQAFPLVHRASLKPLPLPRVLAVHATLNLPRQAKVASPYASFLYISSNKKEGIVRQEALLQSATSSGVHSHTSRICRPRQLPSPIAPSWLPSPSHRRRSDQPSTSPHLSPARRDVEAHHNFKCPLRQRSSERSLLSALARLVCNSIAQSHSHLTTARSQECDQPAPIVNNMGTSPSPNQANQRGGHVKQASRHLPSAMSTATL